MNYTDKVFALFFVMTFIAYYLSTSIRAQLFVLISASLFFYAWEFPLLLAIFLCSWLITGITSYYVLSTKIEFKSKALAMTGVAGNLLILGFFKYKFLVLQNAFGMPTESAKSLADWLIMAPLPIGISFYTFHGISLMVDVFRSHAPIFAERKTGLSKHLAETLLYLVFFPQLIAGPIIKAKDFYPQVRFKKFSDIDFAGSFRSLVAGYFLKSVVADNLADQTFWISYPYFQWKSSGDLVVMLYGYAAQIFADFAGYSLIAIGLAKLLGYKLPDNFNFPYLSSSISDFWHRWHISLSSWLREYLYIPLGGNRNGSTRTYFNLIIVMLIGGLWHGAAWGFAVWGLWHGIGLAFERPWRNSYFMTNDHPVIKGIRIFMVFHFVTVGWLFFKLQDFSHARSYFNSIVSNDVGGLASLSTVSVVIIFYGMFVFIYHMLNLIRARLSRSIRDCLYGVMLFLIVTNSGPAKPFIYFQF